MPNSPSSPFGLSWPKLAALWFVRACVFCWLWMAKGGGLHDGLLSVVLQVGFDAVAWTWGHVRRRWNP